MPAQANQQMQMHADPALVDLAELAVLAEMAEMTSDHETVAALQDIVNSPGHGGSTCSPAQASANACGSIPAQANQQVQMHAVPVCVELAELALDGYTVVAPQGIVSPGHAGTGHARAPVGVPWAALADRWRRHWETKRTDSYSSSASVTTSTYSYRSSSSSDVSRPTPGSTATPAPPPPGAPPAVPPAAPSVAPPPLPADLAQMCDEPIGLDGALAAPPTRSAAPIISSSSWLEQQELAEVLEEQLTGLEAIEVSKLLVRDSK